MASPINPRTPACSIPPAGRSPHWRNCGCCARDIFDSQSLGLTLKGFECPSTSGRIKVMEMIRRNVADLDHIDRSALERVVGHALSESQRVVIQVTSNDSTPAQPRAGTYT